MARPTSQWTCIAILALMASTLTTAHMVKPPPKTARSRKFQMDTLSEPETTNLQANDLDGKTTQPHGSQTYKSEASASSCGGGGGGSITDRGIFGSGHGSGGTSIGFNNIFPFPGFPFGIFVPQVSTWGEGEGDGYGGSENNPGIGTNCQCNQFPMHYVITPVYFQPTGHASVKNRRRDGHSDVAAGPSRN